MIYYLLQGQKSPNSGEYRGWQPRKRESCRLSRKLLDVRRDGEAAGHLPWDCTNVLKLLVVAKAANSSWQQLGRETEQ